MKTLLKDPEKFYRPKGRPSVHDIAESFGRQNGGAIPSNLLQIPNTDSNSHYLRACKLLGEDSHPARFPEDLPRFFIRFLTSVGDVVVDIFSGSNTTGYVAECLGRHWLSIELDRAYARLSAVRFMEGQGERAIRDFYEELQRRNVLSLRLPLHRPKSTIPVEADIDSNAAQPTLFS
jgi:site-specific DNA-methyltransferase (cytosine-N4-specific)